MTAELRSSPQTVSPAANFTLRLGNLGIALDDGYVRRLTWQGQELLRGVAYPIRDADWGTVQSVVSDEVLTTSRDAALYSRKFTASTGGFAGHFTLEASASGHITLDLSLVARRQQIISRAGFTLLHPIASLAGGQLTIVHSDGTEEETHFPEMISPSQPARDIAGMRYEIGGCAIEIAMRGDVFEMEDQRNWSDASYKTYCRPLSRSCPYVVQKHEVTHQRLEISLHGERRSAAETMRSPAGLQLSGKPPNEVLPSVALAIEPEWQHRLPSELDDVRRIVRIDLRHRHTAVLTDITAPFDLELVTGDESDEPRAQLLGLAAELASSNLVPDYVLALPGAYLKSYQPDAQWPTGATPSEVIASARAAFPSSRIGGGMLTNFTEFNRCRPEPDLVDYVSHGSSAIVHAADDQSIFQTIEALPQIFASTRSIAPDVPYRLGLVSIGMRTNPYGAGLADNPEGLPRTMTADDPRARTLFGAAWMVATMAATTGFDIEVITLGSPAGPFGIVETDAGRLRPSFHVVRGLHLMRGLPRTNVDCDDPALHVVAVITDRAVRVILANGSAHEKECSILSGAHGSILDQTTKDTAATDSRWTENADQPLDSLLRLAPYAVAFLSFPRREGRSP